HFIGVTRPGHKLETAGLPDAGVSLLEVPAMAISSTDCRARVAEGKPVWYLVPDGVVQYIGKYGLYRKGRKPKVDDFARPRLTDEGAATSMNLPPRAVGAGK